MNLGDTGTGMPDFKAPDTMDEEEIMLSLEAQADDIEMVIRDIHRFDGVSQKMVTPIRHLIPTNVKLSSYTQNPTHTNLKVTMEALDLKASFLIAAALAAFAALVIKIVSWLISLFKRNDAGTAAAAKSAEQMTSTLKTNGDLRKIMTPEIEREYKTRRDDKVNPIYDEMAKMWNPILRDLLNAGPVARGLYGANATFVDIIKKVQLILKVIQDEGRKDNAGDDMAAARVMTSLNDLEVRRDDPAIREAFSTIYRVTTQPVDYQADMREIADHLNSQMAQAYSNSFNGDKVVKDLEGYDVKKCPLYKMDSLGDLEGLLKAITSVEGMTFNKNVGVEVDRSLRKCLSSLRSMVETVQKYETVIAKVIKQRNDFIELGRRAATNDNSSMIGAIVSSDNSEVKDKLREMNKGKKK